MNSKIYEFMNLRQRNYNLRVIALILLIKLNIDKFLSIVYLHEQVFWIDEPFGIRYSYSEFLIHLRK